MLAEAFFLRLEAMSRNAETRPAASGDRHFVPIKPTVAPAVKKSAADR